MLKVITAAMKTINVWLLVQIAGLTVRPRLDMKDCTQLLLIGTRKDAFTLLKAKASNTKSKKKVSGPLASSKPANLQNLNFVTKVVCAKGADTLIQWNAVKAPAACKSPVPVEQFTPKTSITLISTASLT
jgi:hypothetical protein